MSAKKPNNIVRPNKATSLGKTLASVLVGIGAKRFVVHRDILVTQSTFFRAALTGGFAEGQSLIVTFPDDDPNIFGMYYHWVYLHEVAFELPCDAYLGYKDLLLAYVLGDKIQDEDFCDAVLDAIVYQSKDMDGRPGIFPDLAVVDLAYDLLPPASPLRRLLVDQCVWHDTAEWFCGDSMLDNGEFYRDVAVALMKERTSGTEGWKTKTGKDEKIHVRSARAAPDCVYNLCRYHLHGQEKVCWTVKY